MSGNRKVQLPPSDDGSFQLAQPQHNEDVCAGASASGTAGSSGSSGSSGRSGRSGGGGVLGGDGHSMSAQAGTPGEKRADGDEWVCVGHRSTLSARTALKIGGRQVTLLRLRRKSSFLRRAGDPEVESHAGNGGDAGARSSTDGAAERWTCVDSICYHAGGPLMQGQVRNVAGRTCIECPWHHYLIDAFTGEGLYMDLSQKYQSKGVRQRVHLVDVRDDHVHVRLVLDGALASDDYAYCGKYFTAGKEVPVKTIPDW